MIEKHSLQGGKGVFQKKKKNLNKESIVKMQFDVEESTPASDKT